MIDSLNGLFYYVCADAAAFLGVSNYIGVTLWHQKKLS